MKAAKMKTSSGTWCYVAPKNWLQRFYLMRFRGYESVYSLVWGETFIRKAIKRLT